MLCNTHDFDTKKGDNVISALLSNSATIYKRINKSVDYNASFT